MAKIFKKIFLVLQNGKLGSQKPQNLENLNYFAPSCKFPFLSSLLNHRGKGWDKVKVWGGRKGNGCLEGEDTGLKRSKNIK